MNNLLLIAAAALYILNNCAFAQEEMSSDTSASAETRLPLWEAGIFSMGYSQPAYPGAEDRANMALVLPYFIYRGEYLRADRGNVGVRTMKTPRMEMDVGVAASVGSHSSGDTARQGMADLGYMVEFGPRLKVNLGDVSSGKSDSRLQFPLRIVIDVSHDFQTRGFAFEPEWVNITRLPGRWRITTSLGAVFGDQKLADTFYGVAPHEATPARASYTAQSGLISLRAGLLASHSITPDVRVFGIARLDSLTWAANRDSPLVRRNSGWTGGIGLAWALGRSGRFEQD